MVISVNVTIQNVTLVASLPVFFSGRVKIFSCETGEHVRSKANKNQSTRAAQLEPISQLVSGVSRSYVT